MHREEADDQDKTGRQSAFGRTNSAAVQLSGELSPTVRHRGKSSGKRMAKDGSNKSDKDSKNSNAKNDEKDQAEEGEVVE